MPDRRYKPGQTPTARELNEANSQMNQFPLASAEGFNWQRGAGGFQINPEPSPFFWIKITAQNGVLNRYSWQQVIEVPASFATWIAPMDGLAGTYSDLVAVEANGNTSVPVNTVVLGRFAADGLSVSFFFRECEECPECPDGPTFELCGTPTTFPFTYYLDIISGTGEFAALSGTTRTLQYAGLDTVAGPTTRYYWLDTTAATICSSSRYFGLRMYDNGDTGTSISVEIIMTTGGIGGTIIPGNGNQYGCVGPPTDELFPTPFYQDNVAINMSSCGNGLMSSGVFYE